MNEAQLFSISEMARQLGVSRATISDLARSWGLTPKLMSNGRAKGLDRADRKVILKALNMIKAPAARSSA